MILNDFEALFAWSPSKKDSIMQINDTYSRAQMSHLNKSSRLKPRLFLCNIKTLILKFPDATCKLEQLCYN